MNEREYLNELKQFTREHNSIPYKVIVTCQGIDITDRYVRADSPQKAVFKAVYYHNSMSDQKADSGHPEPQMPTETVAGENHRLAF